MRKQTILVTGSAGFIGFHLSRYLLKQKIKVIGLDNFNDYYNVSLKENRNKILEKYSDFKLYKGDLKDLDFLKRVFQENEINKVCHLAAQAGIRYSLTNPHTYIQTNIVGFTNLIEETQNAGIKTFVYASSSSIYGENKKVPFSVGDRVEHPISLYGATKRANELIAYTYHHLYSVNCTGLRFFTVYGPWGRPDMAYFKFTKAILEERPIEVYNYGKMKRDFTYIDDIVRGTTNALKKSYPYEIFNLGNNQPVELEYFISCIEKELGKKAKKKYFPLQPGDILGTYADIDRSIEMLNYHPRISLEQGIKKFVEWYKDYCYEKFK